MRLSPHTAQALTLSYLFLDQTTYLGCTPLLHPLFKLFFYSLPSLPLPPPSSPPGVDYAPKVHNQSGDVVARRVKRRGYLFVGISLPSLPPTFCNRRFTKSCSFARHSLLPPTHNVCGGEALCS